MGGGKLAKYCDIVPELLHCRILDITQHIHQFLVRRKSPIFHFLSQQSHNNKEVLFIQLEMTVYEQLLCGLQVLPNKYNTLLHQIVLSFSFLQYQKSFC